MKKADRVKEFSAEYERLCKESLSPKLIGCIVSAVENFTKWGEADAKRAQKAAGDNLFRLCGRAACGGRYELEERAAQILKACYMDGYEAKEVQHV